MLRIPELLIMKVLIFDVNSKIQNLVTAAEGGEGEVSLVSEELIKF